VSGGVGTAADEYFSCGVHGDATGEVIF